MKKPKVTFLIGLPASGKTTWSKEQLKKNSNIKRVNKDDLRAMIDNGQWSKNNEKLILEIRDKIIMTAIENGNDVIVDDTNFHSKHLEHIKELVPSNVEIKTKFFDVPFEECILRDSKRENKVGKDVIMRMYNDFLKSKEKIKKIDELPKAIIVDIDGTLAHITNGRSPYEWSRVGEDEVDENVANIIKFCEKNCEIILLSGRDKVCETETRKWLYDNNIYYNNLYMREKNDMRKDTIVKKELFDKYIRGKYNIDFILDDRNCMVKFWREMGLVCFQVADGNF